MGKKNDPALNAMKREVTHIVNDVDPYNLRPHDHYGEEGAEIARRLFKRARKGALISTLTVNRVVTVVWVHRFGDVLPAKVQGKIAARVCELLPTLGVELS
jgi:hypothetical protein